jgi:hypothetical protein
MKIRPVATEFFMESDGQTEYNDEANIRFSRFCERTYNDGRVAIRNDKITIRRAVLQYSPRRSKGNTKYLNQKCDCLTKIPTMYNRMTSQNLYVAPYIMFGLKSHKLSGRIWKRKLFYYFSLFITVYIPRPPPPICGAL